MEQPNSNMTLEGHEVALQLMSGSSDGVVPALEPTTDPTLERPESYWRSQGLPTYKVYLPTDAKNSAAFATCWDKVPLEIQEEILKQTLLAEWLQSQRMELIVHRSLASKRAAQALKRPLRETIQRLEAVLASYVSGATYASGEGPNYETPLWIDTICSMYGGIQPEDEEDLDYYMRKECISMETERANLERIINAISEAEHTTIDATDELELSWGVAQLPTNVTWVATLKKAGVIKTIVTVLVDYCFDGSLGNPEHYYQGNAYSCKERWVRGAELTNLRMRFFEF